MSSIGLAEDLSPRFGAGGDLEPSLGPPRFRLGAGGDFDPSLGCRERREADVGEGSSPVCYISRGGEWG